MTTPKTLTVRLCRCADVPDWSAHLLDVDLITQGDSPEHALEMLADAIRVCQEDDEHHGLCFWDRKPDPTYGRPVMLCSARETRSHLQWPEPSDAERERTLDENLDAFCDNKSQGST